MLNVWRVNQRLKVGVAKSDVKGLRSKSDVKNGEVILDVKSVGS